MVVQLLSGWLLTTFYTPDLSSVKGAVGKEVDFGQTSIVPFLATLLVVPLAYFFSQKIFSAKNN